MRKYSDIIDLTITADEDEIICQGGVLNDDVVLVSWNSCSAPSRRTVNHVIDLTQADDEDTSTMQRLSTRQNHAGGSRSRLPNIGGGVGLRVRRRPPKTVKCAICIGFVDDEMCAITCGHSKSFFYFFA
jgi:hypothetical protein